MLSIKSSILSRNDKNRWEDIGQKSWSKYQKQTKTSPWLIFAVEEMVGSCLLRNSVSSMGFILSTCSCLKRTLCTNWLLSPHRRQLKDSHGGSPEPCGH